MNRPLPGVVLGRIRLELERLLSVAHVLLLLSVALVLVPRIEALNRLSIELERSGRLPAILPQLGPRTVCHNQKISKEYECSQHFNFPLLKPVVQ